MDIISNFRFNNRWNKRKTYIRFFFLGLLLGIIGIIIIIIIPTKETITFNNFSLSQNKEKYNQIIKVRCPKCSSLVEESSFYCQSCGNQLKKENIEKKDIRIMNNNDMTLPNKLEKDEVKKNI